ncbi:hypothetical protein [Peribacillus sp. B2I2]|uniref:hypothetical protein n=1 Tax=Peribacillus sp. B2I2 TaxID=3156468 RepID=UPI0035128234
MEELRPIIPTSGVKVLGDNAFKIAREETDLIKDYRPKPMDGIAATIGALKEIDAILQNPRWFKDILEDEFLLENWRNENNHTVELFHEKYSSAFFDYCIDNKIGHESEFGINIPEELAKIYMTILAHYISEENNIPVITDEEKMNRTALLLGKKKATNQPYFNAVTNVISLKLPVDISGIDIMSVISIRNSKGYKQKIRAFHRELQSFYSRVENSEFEEQAFIDSMYSLKETIRMIVSEFIPLGAKTLNIGLSTLLSVKTTDLTPLLVAKETASFGEYSLGTVQQVTNFWSNGSSRRDCKKFLADISKIPVNPQMIGSAKK